VDGGTTVKAMCRWPWRRWPGADDREATLVPYWGGKRTTCQWNRAVLVSSEELKRNEFAPRVAGGL